MKIKCPVALCLWEGKTHDFWKHIEDYKTTWKNVMDSGFPRSESHERWASYFFPKIWNSPDLPEKVRWTNIAVAYVNQIKNQNKMAHRKGKLSPEVSSPSLMAFLSRKSTVHDIFPCDLIVFYVFVKLMRLALPSAECNGTFDSHIITLPGLLQGCICFESPVIRCRDGCRILIRCLVIP